MCDCLNTIGRQLEEFGLHLATGGGAGIQFNTHTGQPVEPTIFLETKRIDPKNRRAKPLVLFVPHCPFCGEEYPPVEERERLYRERALKEKTDASTAHAVPAE